MNKRLEATINGHVQGVNFRYYTQQTANELHLSGWVMNQPDGSVRVMAEGPSEKLERLAEFLRHGQPPARVDQVELIWAKPTQEFTRFSIRWFGNL